MNCIVCQKELVNNQRKYCSVKCKSANHKGNNYIAQQSRGLSRKLYFVAQLGGCCQKCGYKKNSAALSFHHREPENKSFQLDLRKLSNCTMEKLQNEVNKCDLLCVNCHFEHHNPTLEMGCPGIEPG